MKRTQEDNWRKIGLALKVMRLVTFEACHLAGGLSPGSQKIPNGLYDKTLGPLLRQIDRSRKLLDERMKEEHPCMAASEAFFPDITDDALELKEAITQELERQFEPAPGSSKAITPVGMGMNRWRLVAVTLRIAREILFTSITGRSNLPKALWRRTTRGLERWIDRSRSLLEDRMYAEHPGSANTGIFYPSLQSSESRYIKEIGKIVEQKICERVEAAP